MPILRKKSHNATTLLYHLVCPVKYRKRVFTTQRISQWLIDECMRIQNNYDIRFESIWVDWDHVHFVVQSVPTFSVTKLVTHIKSFTAKKLLKFDYELKWKLRWWEFRTDWYYANTVGASGWFDVIKNYVMNQWYWTKWFKLFDAPWWGVIKQNSLFG